MWRAVRIRSIEVKDTIALRHSVLWPDHPVSYVSLPEDAGGLHFGAFLPAHNDETPIGIISLFIDPIPTDQGDLKTELRAARFRKFAVDPTHQGRGVGTMLLEHVFSVAFSELLVEKVWCDARLTSVEWYQKRGMLSFGETFYKENLEYIRMQKCT